MYGKILATSVALVLPGKMKPVPGPLMTAFERVDIPFHTPPSRSELQARLKDTDSNIRAQSERMVTVPSLMTVRPRLASSSMLTWMAPSFALHSSSVSLKRFVA